MNRQSLEFGSGSVSDDYDSVLVPLLFEPWAEQLLEELPPQPEWSVLDLAAGTGIVAEKVAGRMNGSGSVVGVDASGDMLALAKQRCSDLGETVRFIESPADSLPLDDSLVDAVYCQQGFQFFPDKPAAAREMRRVLRPGGKVAVSTWCSIDECEFFGILCGALDECGEDDIAHMMSLPFNFMAEQDLLGCFSDAEFENVTIRRRASDLVFTEGIEQACESIYATPIAPRLLELSPARRAQIQDRLVSGLTRLTTGGVTTATMVSLVLTADKSTE